jgi:DNA-directed RNA polymerase specialized sigma24 family protein
MKRRGGKSFEECIEIIDTAISKQKSRWRLDSISWFDFEDVRQIIKLHIYKKWHMWDQKRPLEPWLATIISNQIKNLIRNHYGNYVKPCVGCQYAVDETGCLLNRSKTQSSECKDYKNWELRKKSAFSLKIPVSTEHHDHEISSKPQQDFSYENSLRKLNKHMERSLSEIHYKAYCMLFFDKCSEEDVAKFMGYKTNEKKRKAGYRQVKNLKKLFMQKATEIIEEFDIIIDEIDF